ncbi:MULTISPECIES: fimbrial protein [Symbiopectobacterium]|uniref:fimbrial protein n=1 Tax=Symbiopectobacterium TaxID=801 RepID=UPI001A1BC1E5|nr:MULTISPECIES: fimbrial protein [Symbiopectobacterium]MBG6248201.1 type 1 fimbrial protein [Candidatus Symbiopectobacterium sp. PLON1]MBT9430906.1 type 1 fimbrial protein [Candidatus Symbiopectobacterium endolongispinus]
MKLTKAALASAIAMTFILSANAADTHNGTVTFKGKVIDTPCPVDQDDLQQTVEFGEISKAVLENGGTAAGTNSELLALNGAASGAGIAVKYSGSKIKFDGTTPAVNASPLSNGDNTFSFSTYVGKLPTPQSGTEVDITTGEFTSTANFVVSYQ